MGNGREKPMMGGRNRWFGLYSLRMRYNKIQCDEGRVCKW